MPNESEEKDLNQAMKLIDKIKDEKLKNAIKAYIQFKTPYHFLELLDHFNIKINKKSIDAIIPEFVADENIIILGGIILSGKLYVFVLIVEDDYFQVVPVKGEVTILHEEDEEVE